MGDTSITDQVIDIVCEQLNVKKSEVTPDVNFMEDLNADSLDTVELVMALEERFNIEIPDEEAENIVTVKDAVNYLEKNVKNT